MILRKKKQITNNKTYREAVWGGDWGAEGNTRPVPVWEKVLFARFTLAGTFRRTDSWTDVLKERSVCIFRLKQLDCLTLNTKSMRCFATSVTKRYNIREDLNLHQLHYEKPELPHVRSRLTDDTSYIIYTYQDSNPHQI